MENYWHRAHKFILDSKIGDFYESGGSKISVVRRSPKRIYFSDGNLVTLKESKHGFYYLDGKKIDQILRDIEGYLLYHEVYRN